MLKIPRDVKTVYITENQLRLLQKNSLLTEAEKRAEVIRTWYPEISDDDFNLIVGADTLTSSSKSIGKYGVWLLNLYKKGQLKIDDLEAVKSYIRSYDSLAKGKRLPGDKTDITKLSFEDMANIANSGQKSNTQQIADDKANGVAIVPQNIDPSWVVYDVLSEAAAIQYGKGTKWCTASTDPEKNRYKHYTEGGTKLYIGVNKSLNRKVQWDYKSGFINDELDKTLVYSDEIASIFKIILALNPDPNATLKVPCADKSVGLMNKEGEFIIQPHLYGDTEDRGEYWKVRLIDDKSVALIDKGSGEYIIQPHLYGNTEDRGEYWEVRLIDDNSVALIDKGSGEYIIEPHLYTHINDDNGYWKVKLLDNSTGAIDKKTRKYIIKPGLYRDIYDGGEYLRVNFYDDSVALVDKKTGEYILEPHLYTHIYDDDDEGYWKVYLRDDNSVALIDKGSGEYIIEPGLYDYIHDMGEYWEARPVSNANSDVKISKKTGEIIKESRNYTGYNLRIHPRLNEDNEDKISFDNWVIPSDQKLEIEFKYEYQGHGRDRETDYAWKTLQEFIQGVNNSEAEMITPGIDYRVGYRSGCDTKEDLIGLISGYRSWPEFRNEKTLQAIYDGFYENRPMDMPIILKFPSGRMSILSGNTRADVAMQLVGEYKAIILEVPETLEERNQVSKVMITESQLKLYLKYLLETNETLKKESDNRIVYDEVSDKPKLNPSWKQKQDRNKVYFYEIMPNGRKVVKCIKSVSNSKSNYYKFINKDEIIEFRLANHWSWYVINYGIADYPVFGKTTYVDVAWGTMAAMSNGVEYVIKLSADRSEKLNKQDVIDAYEIYKGDIFINLDRKTLKLLDKKNIWGMRIYKNLSGNMELPQ